MHDTWRRYLDLLGISIGRGGQISDSQEEGYLAGGHTTSTSEEGRAPFPRFFEFVC